jgi:hypothetical protein
MGKQLDRIKIFTDALEIAIETVPEFEGVLSITADEKQWALSCLNYFRAYIEGSPVSDVGPQPEYDDDDEFGGSVAIHVIDQHITVLKMMVAQREEKRGHKNEIKKLQERLEQRDSQIKNLQDQLASKNNRVKQLKGAIIELRDQLVSKNKRICQFKRTIVGLRDRLVNNTEDDSFVHVGNASEPDNELGLFFRLFKKT